jgi:hypothetical protein
MDHDKAARRALLVAKALKHHVSVIHNPASIMGNPPPPVARYGMMAPHLAQIAPVARAEGGEVDPAYTQADLSNTLKNIKDPNISMPSNLVDQEIAARGYEEGGYIDGDDTHHFEDGGDVEGFANGGPSMSDKADSHKNLASQLGEVRGTEVGKMVSRYQNMNAERAHKLMHGDLKKLAMEGEPGRYWYENSSKEILNYLGGDKNEADKLAQLIAIYSPQTTVPVNTQNAIKAYNRAKIGHTIWNGQIIDKDKSFPSLKAANDYIKSIGGSKAGYTKIPLDDTDKRFLIAKHGNINDYDNIATADRDLKAHLVMNEGIPFEGRKINNFYNNLMVHIDPSRLQGSTQDLWMARAFGFLDDAVGGGAKYDYMEKLTHKLAKELGWKPHQVQAAIWTAIKTRQEGVENDVKKKAVEDGIATISPDPKTGKPKFKVNDGMDEKYASLMRNMSLGADVTPEHIENSAKDFSHFLKDNLAHVAWESAPGVKSKHLEGFENLSPEAKAEYHTEISKALQDENGNDMLAKYLGMLSPGNIESPGYWEGASNPATHQLIASTRIKGAGQKPDIDEASKGLMNTYADAMGLLLKQDGVGYHRPFYNPQISKANGMEYSFHHDDGTPMSLTSDHIVNLGKKIDQHVPGAALIPVGSNKLRMLNFGYGGEDQREFHNAIDSVVKSGILPNGTARKKVFASDGELRSNDWERNPNGEDYRSRLSASGRPDVLEHLSTVLAPRVQAVDERFADKYGLKRNTQIEDTLRNFAPQETSAPQQVAKPAAAPQSAPAQPNEGSAGSFASGGHIVDQALHLTSKFGNSLPSAVNQAKAATRRRP